MLEGGSASNLLGIWEAIFNCLYIIYFSRQKSAGKVEQETVLCVLGAVAHGVKKRA
jgi:hypothetical protein